MVLAQRLRNMCREDNHMNESLPTKEAVLLILRETGCSKYRLAKNLDVNPIMINNYIRDVKPSKMSKPTASLMKQFYGITITDIYNPIKEV